MQDLVAASRQVAALRSPLTRHPQMTDDLAKVLYTWVGDALQKELTAASPSIPKRCERPCRGRWTPPTIGNPPAGLVIATPSAERRDMDTRLIAKLQAAGQLRPGFLLKCLREGKLYLFELSLAALAQMKTEEVRAIVASDPSGLLARLRRGRHRPQRFPHHSASRARPERRTPHRRRRLPAHHKRRLHPRLYGRGAGSLARRNRRTRLIRRAPARLIR